jgi:hypothetical protein
MKKLFSFAFLVVLLSVSISTYAQPEENRTKIQLTVLFGGKSIMTDLNGVSTSLSRNYDVTPVINVAKDSVNNKIPESNPGAFYLTLEAKKVNDDLLKVFAKKQNRFDGTITIVDTYGKNPTKTIKFKQASLYSYSEQLSAGSYSETYGTAVLSITCRDVAINGVSIEQ